jgi:Putative metallopeptidase
MLSLVDRLTHPGDASAPDAMPRGAMKRKPAAIAAILAATALTLAATCSAKATPKRKPNQVRYEYVSPKNPAHQAIHDQMQQNHALEHLQEMLSPLRLPYPLTLKVAGCDGAISAWYDDEVITVCYELLAELLKNAPTKDLPIGVSRADTVLGPVLDVFLHETGHAVFNMLQIPVLGREEDAADQFSAYVMLRLRKDEARRMILGSAYQHSIHMPGPEFTVPINSFSDEHSLPAQRAFNILCIAYGADKKLFVDIVEKDFLPKRRAEGCETEYEDLTFAMTKLISPHIDKRLARKFHEVWTRTVSARRAHFARQ